MAKLSASTSRTCLRSWIGSIRHLRLSGLGALKVDIAYGGDTFVIADAAVLGFAIRPGEARDLAETGVRIFAAANEQLGFTHLQATGWDHISFCQFAGPLTREGNELQGSNAVVVRPGKIDRSPTGSGCSARTATQDARGLMGEGDVYRACSIIGSEFICPDRVPGDWRPAGHNAGRYEAQAETLSREFPMTLDLRRPAGL